MSVGSDPGQLLVDWFRPFERCVVAFSGGVDSVVVACAAVRALGEHALAVTAVSPSLAEGEREHACQVAADLGLVHQVIETDELNQPDYAANPINRCFFCKSELYGRIQGIVARFPEAVVVNGTNVDDLGDYRPGLEAARQFGVRSPLVECGLDKNAVRALARHWQLSVAERPATPCLASRIAYGEPVTAARLRMIDRAEAWLKAQGMGDVRVRLHPGDLARIELPPAALACCFDPLFREAIEAHLRQLGFRFVTIDLQGRRSGSMNQLVPTEQLLMSVEPRGDSGL